MVHGDECGESQINAFGDLKKLVVEILLQMREMIS